MAVDLEIDGTQPSCSPRRRERAGARGTAGEATCRRRASTARVGVDGGDSGKLLGGLVLAGSGRCVGGEFLFFPWACSNSGEVLATALCTKQRGRRGV